ncbi:MurR/RpiR family transcriptional regulator [Candidimonas sp. SYP-B2681]|uniref:MurR/RpiR family transcriptional regulator n=1 Tax=Candidimonas sp. SYP-B2681 TaxID=2497686 RepID=UPI001315820E|nr:MurR/RpiR family transcriptional regulator [Candidimonas sp. SYP-B2681]
MTVESIEDLRRFLEYERRGTGRGRVGDKTLAVLADMLNRPGAAAVESISEIAAHSRVDPSTLTRLGKRLGFTGFTELQDIFRRHVTQTQPFYSTRIHERVLDAQGNSQTELLRHHAATECQKLLAAVDKIDPLLVDQAADLLASAKNVFVLGLRATYGLSFFLGSYLATIRDNVRILGGPGQALTSDLIAIHKDDLLVAISFSPYTRNVVTSVDIAKDIGAKVLSITDAVSPLEVAGSHGVTIAVDQPFYFDSATSHFFVLQAILLATARRIGPAAVEVSKRREFIDKALNIEVR